MRNDDGAENVYGGKIHIRKIDFKENAFHIH